MQNKTNAENVIDDSSIKAIHDNSTTNLNTACTDNHEKNLKEVPKDQTEECYGKDSSRSPAIVTNDSFNFIPTNIPINDTIEEMREQKLASNNHLQGKLICYALAEI